MTRPRISVIIPTRNGAGTLALCLQALRSSSCAPHEIIVVDDASSDSSAEIAKQFACRVVRLDENIGAARAKNLGAKRATGDIFFFTDDDVLVSNGALERISNTFADTGVDGVVGLFTAQIPFQNLPSNYKNLWMRFTYKRVPRERIGLFYTSVAAIRRQIFEQLGGFDENYRGASIAEDTEFGQRAWSEGHNIILDPDFLVTHQKHYTFGELFSADFHRARALMLMRLRKRDQPFFTSVPLFYQLAVPVVCLMLACIIAGVAIANWPLIFASLLLLAAFYLLFLPWLAYLSKERGILFSLAAALIQPLDALAVALGMVVATFEYVRGVRY